MYLWTNEEIEAILKQLDEQMLPFSKYKFSQKGKELRLLGRGGYALVYEAELRERSKKGYAIKVIGFGEKHVDSEDFSSSVEAQKDLYIYKDNIVKIYDYAEFWVQIDENNHVVSAQKASTEEKLPNLLKLQFVVMEKLEPVLSRDKAGKRKLTPEALANFEEQEILKLAHDIGMALSLAHGKGILHRDVKLENVFYCAENGQYRLGDFGNAKITDNGLASTTAYTRGYGAPEVVGSLEEKYDNTADIYSMGMMLYVLLNKLRFPESDRYTANIGAQYQRGYILPVPEQGDSELFEIVKKMCMYEPDDRHQSMEEVLSDLERLILKEDVHYKKEHKRASLVMGTVLLFVGCTVGTLAFGAEWNRELSTVMYVFWGLGITRLIFYLLKKETFFAGLVFFVLGSYLLIITGFTWWKLLLFTGMMLYIHFCGLVSGGVLVSHITYLLIQQNPAFLQEFQGMQWVAVTLLSLAAVLFLQYFVLHTSDPNLIKLYYGKNFYWIIVTALYFVSILFGSLLAKGGLTWMPCKTLLQWLTEIELTKVGMAGFVFCIIWLVRERVLMRMESKQQAKG